MPILGRQGAVGTGRRHDEVVCAARLAGAAPRPDGAAPATRHLPRRRHGGAEPTSARSGGPRRPAGTSLGSGRIRTMTEIPSRLSIVTLGTRDMAALRSFYQALGWPELPSGDDTWTGFLLGGVLLAL